MRLLALFDFVPVILFILAAVRLQRGLYGEMSKGCFALFCGGCFMIVTAGIFKACWKLLYAFEICDFARLNQCFFPMQSIGLLLAGSAVMVMDFVPQNRGRRLNAVAPPLFAGTALFVIASVLGTAFFCIGLIVRAHRNRNRAAMICFTAAFIFMLFMGYMSGKDFDSIAVNCAAEMVNTVAQIFLLVGSSKLFSHKMA